MSIFAGFFHGPNGAVMRGRLTAELAEVESKILLEETRRSSVKYVPQSNRLTDLYIRRDQLKEQLRAIKPDAQ